MTEDRKPDSLKDLDERIERLRREEKTRAGRRSDEGTPTGGLGLGFRIATELVAAFAVGGGIGYLLDRALGTAPWLMVAFLVLGAAAGMLNVYRVMMRINQVVGLGRDRPKKDD